MQTSGPVVRGGWQQERVIGTGGFGTVTLWRNEEQDTCLALKRCRVLSEMTAKHRDRWKKEIDIMLRLNHPNVIMAVLVPEELSTPREELPLLGMEYCVGGDLRKVLVRPENCTGLPEYQVRALVHDVASGIEYLHHTRIIHRDLKPENIVLQKVDEKTVYKIIDLGYAKDLEQGSVCTSFVGTLQYLAPELFTSQWYNCTVDYWSFGILVFETITGFRPFLPNMQPLKWHQEVSRKDDDDIYVYSDRQSETKYSKNIPTPNHLCRTSRQHFEQWLRLMLMWDSQSRGGGLEEKPTSSGTLSKRPKCFRILDNILNMKLVFILCVSSGQVLTYPVQEGQSLASLQVVIEQETKIPVPDQELLLASGISPEPEKPAEQGWAEMAEEEWLVFLFVKNTVTYQTQNRRLRPPPEQVQLLLREPNTVLQYQDQRVVWGHAVYFCSEVARDYRRLLQAQRAAMMSLLRGNSNFSKLKLNLDSEFVRLQAQAEFFKHGLLFDITKYQDQTSTGISSQKLTTKWKKMEEESVRFLSMKDDVLAIDAQYSALSTRVVELQRSPFAKMKRIDVLEENEKNAREEYAKLRQTSKDMRHTIENKTIITLVKKCQKDRERLTTELYHHLGKIAQCKQELDSLSPKLEKRMSEIEAAKEKLLVNQRQRQNDMWTILRMAIKQTTAPFSSSQPSSLQSGHTGASSDSGAPISGPGTSGLSQQASQSITNGATQSSLASIVERSSLESVSVVTENQTIKNKLLDLIGSLQDEHSNSMTQLKSLDWGFMSDLDGSSGSTKPMVDTSAVDAAGPQQTSPSLQQQQQQPPVGMYVGPSQSYVYTDAFSQPSTIAASQYSNIPGLQVYTSQQPTYTSQQQVPTAAQHQQALITGQQPSVLQSHHNPILTHQQQLALSHLLQQAAGTGALDLSANMANAPTGIDLSQKASQSPALSPGMMHGLPVVEEEASLEPGVEGGYQPVPAPRSYPHMLSQNLSNSRSATPSPPPTSSAYSAHNSPLHKLVGTATPGPPTTTTLTTTQAYLTQMVANGAAYISHTQSPHIRVSPPMMGSPGHKRTPPRIPPRSTSTSSSNA